MGYGTAIGSVALILAAIVFVSLGVLYAAAQALDAVKHRRPGGLVVWLMAAILLVAVPVGSCIAAVENHRAPAAEAAP